MPAMHRHQWVIVFVPYLMMPKKQLLCFCNKVKDLFSFTRHINNNMAWMPASQLASRTACCLKISNPTLLDPDRRSFKNNDPFGLNDKSGLCCEMKKKRRAFQYACNAKSRVVSRRFLCLYAKNEFFREQTSFYKVWELLIFLGGFLHVKILTIFVPDVVFCNVSLAGRDGSATNLRTWHIEKRK